MDLVTNVVRGSESDRLLLLLHGYGADERDLGGLLRYLDPEGHFVTVLPRGPIAAPPGFSWYDIGRRRRPAGDGRRVRRGARRDRRPARRRLRGARHAAGGRRRRRLLAGRRPGARAGAGTERPGPPGRCAGDEPVRRPRPARRSTSRVPATSPSCSSTAPTTRWCRWPATRELAKALAEAGVPVVFAEYPMGHEVALESVQQAHAVAGGGPGGRAPVGAAARAAARGPGEGGDDRQLPRPRCSAPTCR